MKGKPVFVVTLLAKAAAMRKFLWPPNDPLGKWQTLLRVSVVFLGAYSAWKHRYHMNPDYGRTTKAQTHLFAEAWVSQS